MGAEGAWQRTGSPAFPALRLPPAETPLDTGEPRGAVFPLLRCWSLESRALPWIILNRPSGSILVVEDTESLRDILASVLTQAGYGVVRAASGTEALSCLRSGAPIGLILLDLVMPMMDGWQFRAEQQRDPRLRHIPVIIVSGESNLAYQAASSGR